MLPHYVFFFISVRCKDKEKVYYMSLQTEVTKGFLVSLQLLCFYGDLREKKTIKRMRYLQLILKGISILAYFGHFGHK